MPLPPGRSGPLRPAAEAARGSAPHCPCRDGGLFFRSAQVICATASLAPMALGRIRGRVVLPLLHRRRGGGPAQPGGGPGPLQPAAEAARESAPHFPFCNGGRLCARRGSFRAGASLAATRWGGPGDGSRYRCAVAGATAVRRPRPASRRARGRFGRRPKRRERARPLAHPGGGGPSFARRRPFLPPLAWPQHPGADPRTGRATTAPPSPRRRSGPAWRRATLLVFPGDCSSEKPGGCPRRGPCGHRAGGEPAARRGKNARLVAKAPARRRLGAAGGWRAGPARPGRAGVPMRRRRRDGGPPLPSSRRAAGSGPLRPAAEAARDSASYWRSGDGGLFLRSAEVTSASACFGARALTRTRGRAAPPMRRRRRDGGPPLPSSRRAAGGMAGFARRLAMGEAAGLPPPVRRRAAFRRACGSPLGEGAAGEERACAHASG